MSDEWKNSLCWNAKVTEHNVPYGCTVEMSPIGRDKIDEINIFRPTTNPNTVICRAFNTEGKPIYETSAKCGPKDVFDFNIGAKLALDRLYEGYDMTPKSKRKPYNGLIYIHHYPGSGLTNSSVYRVVNGKIVGCWFHSGPESDPYIFSDMTDDQLSRKLQIEVYGSDAPSAKVIAYFIHNDKT